MKILVTGGCGFIGSHFIHHVLSQYPQAQVINLDCLTYAGFLANHQWLHDQFAERYRWIKARVGDAHTLTDILSDITHVAHLAAESNVDLSLENGQQFLNTNILETQSLLEQCRRAPKLKRFLLISTDEVYGNPWQGKPSHEEDPLLPCSPYAASKAGQDLLAYSYYHSFGLPVVRSRGVNNYGPRQDPTKLIPRFALHALHNQALPLYGHGQNRREWLHVSDHCRALALLLFHPDDLSGEIFNVGSGVEHSAHTIGRHILHFFERDPALLQSVTDRTGHVERHAVNANKLQALGWQTQISWQTGFEDTLRWYENNPQWIQAAIAHQGQHLPGYSTTYGFTR